MAMISAGGSGTPVDFDSEVIPILTKAGCNTGACHGAAVGRGGFKLSLYGSDPQFDYQSIVMDLEGRRVNLAVPDESLLVQKPTEMIEHGGGYLLDFDSTAANLLIRWIHQGALRSQIMHLEEFRVSPEYYVAVRVGATLQLKATVLFSGRPTIDVTQWTVFIPEDPGAVEIDPETAKTKLLRRGRHVVVARFLDQVIPIEMVVPLSDETVDLSHNTRRNFIDDHVLKLLSTLHLPVSPAADDAAFHRRITLDLTGRLPSVNASLAFLDNPSKQKREKLIDQLLQSEEFDEYWTLQFAKLLRIHSQPGDAQGELTYHKWLKKQIANEVSYDQFAREIIMASGDTHLVGPANFYRTVGGAREQAEFASELFMGNRLRCANCHNHPLDHWTQDDYHGLAAIFAKIKQGRVIEVANRGEVTHPRTGEPANQRIPGERFLDHHEDGR